MSGKPAARLGDPTQCPQTGHGARAIASGAPNVLFNGKPAARLGDSTTCGSSLAGQVIPNVLINGRPAAVLGSTGSHGDAVIAGSGNIFIGTTTGSASTAVQAVGALVRTLQALFGAPLATRASIANAAPLQREEEEEEEETELPQKQRITLRVGMFSTVPSTTCPTPPSPPNAAAKTWPNSAPTASKPSPASANPTAITTATAMPFLISGLITVMGMS
ncbi:PAAR domain-containing protein [Halopseudomonas pachastrellae]|nr:PAAR domain-containing protein [Halopseudomonas pachastrellae]